MYYLYKGRDTIRTRAERTLLDNQRVTEIQPNFALIARITAAAITGVLYLNSRNTLLTSTQALLDQVAGRIDENAVAFLSPAATASRLSGELARSGSLDLGDLSSLEAFY